MVLDTEGCRQHQKDEDQCAAQAKDAIVCQQSVARDGTQVAKVLGTGVVSQDFGQLYFRGCSRGPS